MIVFYNDFDVWVLTMCVKMIREQSNFDDSEVNLSIFIQSNLSQSYSISY